MTATARVASSGRCVTSQRKGPQSALSLALAPRSSGVNAEAPSWALLAGSDESRAPAVSEGVQMAPALSAAFMCGQVFWRVQSSETKEELDKLFARFVSDLVSKEEVCCKPSASPLPEQPPTPLPGPAALTSPLRRQFTAELARIAGIPACMSALEAIRPQLDFVLYAEPYPDADYTDPRLKDDANICFTADDLLKIHGGRAVAWAAPRQTRAVRQKMFRAALPAFAPGHLLAPRATKVAPNWGPDEVALSSA